MSDRTELWKLRPLDWAWVGIGYCFFVTFHMLPSFFIFGVNVSEIHWGNEYIGAFWLFFGLAYVAYLIGVNSHGITIAEPALSALLYTVTLVAFMGRFTGQELSVRSVGTIYVIAVCIVVVAIMSAWVGEKVQLRREGKGQ